MSDFTAVQERALDAALAAIRTYTRLEELRSDSGYLTSRQEEDFSGAVRSWNDAISAVPELKLPGLDHAWSDEQLNKSLRVLEAYKKHAEGQHLGQAVRAVIGNVAEGGSGDPSGYAAGKDEIRALIESGERQHDFDLVGGFEQRAIADFSDNTALYASDFSSSVAMYLRTESPWFNLASIVRADNGRPLIVPQVTADTTTYTPGEGTAITESTPTLGTAQVTLTSYKTLSYVSEEGMEDVEYNLTDVLAQSAARSIALAFGSGATTTILSGLNNGGTATGLGGGSTATFVGYEDLIDLKYTRAEPYRKAPATSWVMANGLISKTRKFKDVNGQYLWQPSPAAGQPGGLDGHPVYEDPNLAAPASATKSVIYGDMASALIIKATNLRVRVSHDARFATDQVALKVVLRAGIAVQDAKAAAYLVSANA